MSDQTEVTYCYYHPQTETTLRCSRCEKLICSKCAMRTPTGYRCRECVRGQQRSFETAQWYDYPLAILLAGLLSFIGSRIVPSLGFFTIFLAPIAGVIIAEVVRAVIRRRRSRRLFQLTTIAAAVGSLPLLLITLFFLTQGGLGVLLGLVWQGLYTLTVTSTVYYRLSGIQMRA